MKLIINGKNTEVIEPEIQIPTTLQILTHVKGFRGGQVLAKLNGKHVPLAKYSETIINDDDSVELLTLLAGG